MKRLTKAELLARLNSEDLVELVEALEPELRGEGRSFTRRFITTPAGGFFQGKNLTWNPVSERWESPTGETYSTVAEYLSGWWQPHPTARSIIELLVDDWRDKDE